MWRWLRTLAFRPPTSPPALRSIVPPGGGDPYRVAPEREVEDRASEPRSLGEVLAALHAAGLRVRPRRRGFVITGRGSRALPVRVRDASRIVPEELVCGSEAPELLLDLALALVPLFGPLLVDVRFAGAIIVDGLRDRASLGEEAAQRIQQFGRRLATRSPFSFAVLIDLAQRMRQQR
ncbi:MAG: hypothetical protein H0T89_31395 [Deltaproteobacteria bacterium]|nr:hypothetical protein [Deltaproteobacteria bacterium]MDQ3298191.1 hypothetical protein [Myxococcota bacterium]